jgi:cell division protein FtsB
MVERSPLPRRRVRRIRWRKLALVVTLGYFAFWSGDSLWHIWRLWQLERATEQQIATVQATTQQLRQEIRQLQNPQQLKPMLTGQKPFPPVANLGTAGN